MTFCRNIFPVSNISTALQKVARNAILFGFIFQLSIHQAEAQRIAFGLHTTHDIIVVPVGNGDLNFSAVQFPIISGSNQVINIGLMDESVAVFEIFAAEEYDLSITVDAPASLSNGEDEIPLQLRFAFSNLGIADDYTARNAANEVITGFTGALFPVLQSAPGAPGPPPTPEYVGYETPVNTVFLYLYGTLGPIGQISTGIYEAKINIHIEYAN